MSNRDADDNIGDETDGGGLVGRLRKFVESDDTDTPQEAGQAGASAPRDVPSAWDPPTGSGTTGSGTPSGQEPAWPPPPAESQSMATPPIPASSTPPPFKATQPPQAPQNVADLPAPPTGSSGAAGLGMGAAAGAGAGAAVGAAASARESASAESRKALDTPAGDQSQSPPSSSTRAAPVGPNGPDDHFGPPDPDSATSPVRERDPWPEKPADTGTAARDVDASGGKRDLLIGLGLIALAGLVAGGVILLNWNRDKDDEPIAGGTTTTVSSSDAVAALATTTTVPAPPVTTSTTTPPIPTTTIPAGDSAAELAAGDSAAIAFVNGSPSVSLGAALLLDELAASVNGSERHVLVRGYAAPSEAGDEQAAVILSLSRANAVRAALIDRGVDPSRMTLFGCGTEKNPDDDAPTSSQVLLQFAPML